MSFAITNLMQKRLLLTYILLFFVGLPAFGQDLREYSQSLPRILSQMNAHQIGEINVSALIEELGQVKWISSTQAITKGSGKPRFACNYFVIERKVLCNTFSTSEANLPLVTLHEGLGALGYVDEDYQISSALAIHALTRKAEAIKGVSDNLLNIKRRTTDEVYRSKGGGTSVGGGGDSVGITIKTFAVATLVSIFNSPELSVDQQARITGAIRRIMASSFENNTQLLDLDVRVEKDENREVVLIPYNQWTWIQFNTTNPQLQSKMTELFDPIFDYFLNQQ